MLLTLEVRLRLRCPTCSAHRLVELDEAANGAFECTVCASRSTFDREELRRQLASLTAAGSRPHPQPRPRR
ncbi:MAG TPA: hypothetical protein VF212_17570 [Longimicrobiales bacterium]